MRTFMALLALGCFFSGAARAEVKQSTLGFRLGLVMGNGGTNPAVGLDLSLGHILPFAGDDEATVDIASPDGSGGSVALSFVHLFRPVASLKAAPKSYLGLGLGLGAGGSSSVLGVKALAGVNINPKLYAEAAYLSAFEGVTLSAGLRF